MREKLCEEKLCERSCEREVVREKLSERSCHIFVPHSFSLTTYFTYFSLTVSLSQLLSHISFTQELCESRGGGRPGLSILSPAADVNQHLKKKKKKQQSD